jgi:TolB-like protein/Flp pilus assembly protein TadD
MFADMVGYTALMQQDEGSAHGQRERQRAVLSELVPRHHGTILQHYGDGTLSVFGSAVEAVECAVEIQRELGTDPRVPVRVGVHSGDIVQDGEDVYGDGVNIASRIDALSSPGGVLVTGKVFDEIKNHPSLPTVSLGRIRLKNVKEPQSVFAIASDGLTVPTKAEVKARASLMAGHCPEAGDLGDGPVSGPSSPAGLGEIFLKSVRERALVQWALIYLVVAWVVVEIVKFLAGHFTWPGIISQGTAVAAFGGFCIALVVTWFHGEKGRQRVRRSEVLLYTTLVLATGGALTMLPGSPLTEAATVRSGAVIASVPDERPAVAVLPFENLSGDGANLYFASGLHDEVLTQLQRVAALRVISRTSVLEYADGENRPNMRIIAGNLGVDFVTEATVQRIGDRLRVNVQLIDARSDDHIWAESYDRQVDDAFGVQSDIAEMIADALAASLTDEERGAMTRPPTADPEAYRLYLQGRDYVLRPGYRLENFTAAEVLYQRAVVLDPLFALVRAELSRVHGLMYWENFDPSAERLAAQMADAEEALRLDPDLPQAHGSMGWAYYVTGDYLRALQEYEVSLEGLPNDAETIARIGYTHRRLGDWDEVFAAFRSATTLSPRNATLYYDLGGHSFLANRRYEEAAEAYARAEMLAPDLHDAAIHRGHTFVHWQGQLDTLGAIVARLPQSLRLPEIELARVEYALWSRDPAAVLAYLGAMPGEVIETQLVYYPKPLFAAWAHRLAGDEDAAAAAFESARETLEALIVDTPDDERLTNSLGYAYAGLGRSQEAADRAVRAMRARQRAGLEISEAPARILAQAEMPDLAVPYLEALLEAYSPISVLTLGVDPLLDPIRNDPGFKALVERYAAPESGGS